MKILNFGSLSIDYVYEVPHFVRPGETLATAGVRTSAGGKGLNQSVALARAGVPVFHAGSVGEGGAFLLDTLKNAGADTRYIQRLSGPCGHTVIQVVPSGENCILVHGGANRLLSRPYIDKVLGNFGNGDLVLLQNEVNELPYLIEAAWERGAEVALNPSPADETIKKLPLDKVSYFVVNELEGAVISGTGNADAIVPAILRKYSHAKVVLTLGARGAHYWDGTAMFRQGAFPASAIDTTAAGDTFLGYFFSGIAGGLPSAETLWTASKAAAIAVSRKGAADSIPWLYEVAEREE